MGGEDGCDGSWGIYFLYRTQMICKKKRTTALKQYQADFPWTENKEVFCFRSSVSSTRTLSGILEPITFWTNYQFIWSGKVYIWLSVWQFQKLFLWQPCINKVMHVENWETDQLQHSTLIAVVHLTINIFRQYQHLLVIVTALLMTHLTSNYHYTYY